MANFKTASQFESAVGQVELQKIIQWSENNSQRNYLQSHKVGGCIEEQTIEVPRLTPGRFIYGLIGETRFNTTEYMTKYVGYFSKKGECQIWKTLPGRENHKPRKVILGFS